MRDFLIGQMNRWKNYSRWSWDWYKLNPYRNTLVATLFVLLLFRSPAETPADDKQVAQASALQVVTVPVVIPIFKNENAITALEQFNIQSLLKEFEELSAEKFWMSHEMGNIEESNTIVDRLGDIRVELRKLDIDAELNSKLVLNSKQKSLVREFADELRVISTKTDDIVKKLFGEEKRCEDIDRRRAEINDVVKKNAPRLPDLYKKWNERGLGNSHVARPVVYEQPWRSYNRTLRLIPVKDRLENKLESKTTQSD